MFKSLLFLAAIIIEPLLCLLLLNRGDKQQNIAVEDSEHHSSVRKLQRISKVAVHLLIVTVFIGLIFLFIYYPSGLDSKPAYIALTASTLLTLLYPFSYFT